mmetsp:Transcript_62357/g.148544  ORF Transcript_62357/g.148544 Transcript_62357/m.148544 type:complete len:314 (+) Transcript_62357:53-994(+)
MILLDGGHPMLKELVTARLGPENAELRATDKVDVTIVDFDGVTYCARGEGDALTIFFAMHGFDEIRPHGVEAYLQGVYSDGATVTVSVAPTSLDGATFNLSLTVDLARDHGEGGDAFASKVSELKRNVLAGPFHEFFDAAREKRVAGATLRLPYRPDENIFVRAGGEDSVVVIFSVVFADKNDRVVAEVFLREFSDVRRDQGLHTSPVVTLHRSPPRELDGEDLGKAGDDTVYISFVLFQRHFAQREKAEASITAVCQFRTYLHYHIKASKSFMHMRMRSRAEDLLGVLNRSKPAPEAIADKKTWSGRSMAGK